MAEQRDAGPFSTAMGRVLKGEYVKAGLTLDVLAERAGIPYYTLRRKIAGQSPLNMDEFFAVVQAIGADAGQLLKEADLMSDVARTKNQLDTKRQQREAAAMSDRALEGQKKAATRDDELDTGEPEAP